MTSVDKIIRGGQINQRAETQQEGWVDGYIGKRNPLAYAPTVDRAGWSIWALDA
jgi:hypothetical protein